MDGGDLDSKDINWEASFPNTVVSYLHLVPMSLFYLFLCRTISMNL